MGIKERLIEFIKSQGISKSEFEKKSCLSNGYINNIREGMGADKVENVLRAFPMLNRSWLITGEGNMITEESGSSNMNNEVPKISYTKGTPYYNVDFIGGFDIVLNDQTTIPEYLIDFKKYNNATCWCNVTGHSMEPEITHGDIIALKRIEDFSFLPYGEVYAIVTRNGMRTIKRLGPSTNKDCYSLIPTNKSPEYGIQDLPKDMIYIVFQVLGCMKRL